MQRKYTILSILLVVLALGLVILPKKTNKTETDPKVLLTALAEKSRFLTTDLVSKRIIENDPTLLLIDLRPVDQFKAFALPGAINIQPESILSDSNSELLKQPGKDIVLYSNSDLTSEKAWLICARYVNYSRLYIMKGGLNEWYNTIVMGTDAAATASSAEFDLVNFRKAARQYFTGAGQTTEKSATEKTPVKITVVRKAPKSTSGGGC
jgi:rhodanese-related sulfurtransferase